MTDRQEDRTTIIEWLTIERLLFGLCILFGAALRFFALAAQPLSTIEASTAWASWLAANGLDGSNSAAGLLSATEPATSSLLYSLNAVLFWLAGGNDILARFLPAVFGTGMIVLAWYLRPHLGRWVALALALLFAIDPWLVSYSRIADGAILSGFFGLLTLVGLLNMRAADVEAGERNRWIGLTAVSAGLLIVSGVQAWSFIPLVLLCFWLCCDGSLPLINQSAADSSSDDDNIESEVVEPVRSATGVSTVMFWGLLTGAALLGATGWLAFPNGLSYLSTSLSAWLAQITGGSIVAGGEMSYSLRWLWLRLFVDQPLLLLFGLFGLYSLWSTRVDSSTSVLPSITMPQRWPLFITLWLLWGTILVLLPGRTPTTLLVLELPLLFAAAQLAGSLFAAFGQVERRLNKIDFILLFALLTALSIAMWIMLTILVHDSSFQVDQARMLLIVAAALIATILFFILWSTRQQAIWTVSLFFFALLSLEAVSNSVQLNHRFDLRAPDAFFAEQTDPDIRALAQNVGVLSSHRIGDPIQAAVVVELNSGPDPLLGWYLRDMQNLRWGSVSTLVTPQEGKTPPFMISYQGNDAVMDDAAESESTGPDGYLGSEYGLRLRWLPTDLPQYVAPEEVAETPPDDAAAEGAEAAGTVAETFAMRINARWGAELRPLLRWMLYKEVDNIPPTERIILWVPVVEG